jgi:hypothetical protein
LLTDKKDQNVMIRKRSLSREASLNSKYQENFHDHLVNQYRELIHEAVLESETDHKTSLNIGKLNAKLQVIHKAAEYDGLSEDIVGQLIDEVMPAHHHRAA